MRHRIRQFAHAGRRPSPDDLALARAWLALPLLDLFLAQHPRDVVHGASTARLLLEGGHGAPDLVVAGFVHDVGKGSQRRLDRVAYVLAAWAGLERRLAADHSRFALRRAVFRSLHHSERGAAMLEAAGATARVVDLTRRHHDLAGPDAMLVLLQRADNLS